MGFQASDAWAGQAGVRKFKEESDTHSPAPGFCICSFFCLKYSSLTSLPLTSLPLLPILRCPAQHYLL